MQSAIYVVLKELLRIEVDPNLFCSKSMLLQMEGSWLSCFSDLIVIWHIVIVQKVGSNPSWLSCSWSSDRRLLSPPAAAAARPSLSSCSLQWATILPTVSIEIGQNLWKYSYCDISNLVKLSPPAAAAPPPSPAVSRCLSYCEHELNLIGIVKHWEQKCSDFDISNYFLLLPGLVKLASVREKQLNIIDLCDGREYNSLIDDKTVSESEKTKVICELSVNGKCI